MEEVAGLVLLIIGVLLVTQRWFWLLVFGLGTLASLFTVIASVVHFQILGAVGFFILTAILAVITSAIADGM